LSIKIIFACGSALQKLEARSRNLVAEAVFMTRAALTMRLATEGTNHGKDVTGKQFHSRPLE
jgi:hypothetical protein